MIVLNIDIKHIISSNMSYDDGWDIDTDKLHIDIFNLCKKYAQEAIDNYIKEKYEEDIEDENCR